MKNKFNISRLIIQFFAVMLFIAATQPASGQEYIRRTTDFYLTDTSIVRKVNNDTTLIYNRNNSSTFMLVRMWNNTVNTWYIDSIYVNDFEVVDKKVYYCGYIIENNLKKAAFGVFNLSQFGNGPLKCNVLEELTELRKLDYYKYTEGPSFNQYYEDHIVMTGAREVRSDVIVDVIVGAIAYAPTFTTCAIYFSDNEYESFDDVAATEKYVVVSTRTKVEGIPVVDFWQFKKPTATWTYISPLNVSHLVLGSPAAETPVILEHIEADKYAAAYKESGYFRMVMLKMSVDSINVSTVEIIGDENFTIIPIDLKYNKTNQIFDILARNAYYREEEDEIELRSVPMQIYHVTPGVLNGTVPGYCTRFTDMYYFIWSIDPGRNNYFLASGETGNITSMFHYSPIQSYHCSEKNRYTYYLGKFDGYNKVDNKEVSFFMANENKEETRINYIDFPRRCSN